MITRLNSARLSLRRLFSRSDWSARLLQLPKSQNTACEPGLILLQIDGLALKQFEQAIKKKRLPFLRRLMRREEYELCYFYSGIPSSTPAVQGELFYGIRSAVPSFSFRDDKTGRLLSMLDMDSAATIENRLKKQGKGLLTHGSAYADIYAGGADEAHFCAVTWGFDRLFKRANPLAILGTLFIYLPVFVRILFLLAVEFCLAIWDFVGGIVQGKEFFKELQFIPTRVAICVVLRELVTFGVRVDAARGVPIIHANFLGYDEQSHRRGPSSAFAHWTLKGIDRCLRQIWLAAQRSSRRSYDVWIYSDHGQEATRPYMRETGRVLEVAVADVLQRYNLLERAVLVGQHGVQLKRAGWLGRGFQWLFTEKTKKVTPSDLHVPAMGPMGHLYLSGKTTYEGLAHLAADLAKDAHIPLIFVSRSEQEVTALNAEGAWQLPRDAAKVFGEDHPFLAEVTEDIINLVRHPNSGALLLSGWRPGKQPLTFPLENGSHAGPGSSETAGFALLPSDAPITLRRGIYIRAIDLADAAQRLLNRTSEGQRPYRLRRMPERKNTLRIMTYNVHRCLGMDGRLSPNRVARAIGRYSPDIVALQEIDVHYGRSGGIDQAHTIAKELEMEFHFHPAFRIEEEKYGDAILSSLPMKVIKAGPLPSFPHLEPRGAIWVTINFNGKQIHLFNTHIGLRRYERTAQVNALLSPEWLGYLKGNEPIILCGDFNTLPLSLNYRKLTSKLIDVQTSLDKHRLRGTLLGLWRIDHVLISPQIKVIGINVPRNALTRAASDHLPLIVDIALPN